jgi:hypothetical protein
MNILDTTTWHMILEIISMNLQVKAKTSYLTHFSLSHFRYVWRVLKIIFLFLRRPLIGEKQHFFISGEMRLPEFFP